MFIIDRKILVFLCLFALLTLMFIVPAKASDGQVYETYTLYQSGAISIEPFWSHTQFIVASLEITNGRAVMTGSVRGQVGTERISVNALLERVNPNGTTTRLGSWNNLQANGSFWAWERVHHVARGHDYRLTLTATVFRNGTSETVSVSRTSRAH